MSGLLMVTRSCLTDNSVQDLEKRGQILRLTDIYNAKKKKKGLFGVCLKLR